MRWAKKECPAAARADIIKMGRHGELLTENLQTADTFQEQIGRNYVGETVFGERDHECTNGN
jgi:hypothetical protein